MRIKSLSSLNLIWFIIIKEGCLGVCVVVKDNINGFNFVNGLNISQFVACPCDKNLVMLCWGQFSTE